MNIEMEFQSGSGEKSTAVWYYEVFWSLADQGTAKLQAFKVGQDWGWIRGLL